MFSLEKCRKIDPSLNLSDEKLTVMRDKLYELGQLIFEDWLEQRGGSKSPTRVLQDQEGRDKI